MDKNADAPHTWSHELITLLNFSCISPLPHSMLDMACQTAMVPPNTVWGGGGLNIIRWTQRVYICVRCYKKWWIDFHILAKCIKNFCPRLLFRPWLLDMLRSICTIWLSFWCMVMTADAAISIHLFMGMFEIRHFHERLLHHIRQSKFRIRLGTEDKLSLQPVL